MIRPFRIEDLGTFIPNEWSEPDLVLDQLLDPSYVTVTIWDSVKQMTAAIMCFKCYAGKCWHGFFLVSKGMTTRQAATIKKYIATTMKKLDADRLQTDSFDEPKLNTWHCWLGFTCEGTRRKMLWGKDYNMWAIVREEV